MLADRFPGVPFAAFAPSPEPFLVLMALGFVVGVDRVGQADALREHGADVVVQDLDELLEDPK